METYTLFLWTTIKKFENCKGKKKSDFVVLKYNLFLRETFAGGGVVSRARRDLGLDPRTSVKAENCGSLLKPQCCGRQRQAGPRLLSGFPI